MSRYDKRRLSLTTPNPAASVSGVLPLAFDYAQIIGFRGSAVTDNASRIGITDGNSHVVYLDAADKAYQAAAIDKVIGQDDTVTGLEVAATGVVDSTGAARVIAAGEGLPVKSPLTVEWSNNGTAGDVFTFDVYYEEVFSRLVNITIANPAATTTGYINLNKKYAQVIGADVFVTTDQTTKLRLTDADSRVFYLDAADFDYTTAGGTSRFIGMDDTLTGLSVTHLDATGAAATATSAAPLPVVKSPIAVAIINNATASDPCWVRLYWK